MGRLFGRTLGSVTLAVHVLIVMPLSTVAAPFTSLDPAFTQEVYGVMGAFAGGVAFAPDNDVWVSSCSSSGGSLTRFDQQTTTVVNTTTVHPQMVGSPFASNTGCGLTNHPDGTLYANIDNGVHGVANLDANTGAVIRTLGPRGQVTGIAVDPQTNHLVYVGLPCRFASSCTLVDLDPVSGTSSTLVTLGSSDATFVDGIYFDPTGNFLFLANRLPALRLTILNRDGTLVRHVAMTSEADGVAFHAASPKFVVTSNTDGTMTRFDFPNDDFTQIPVQSTFASGGFRSDLSQVGADGCLYVTQDGTRFDNNATSTNNSVVRICPGFAPPPGVVQLDHFLTYKIKASKKTPAFPAVPAVPLQDQFDTAPVLFDVTKPAGLGNPADKNGEGIFNATTHLESYRIRLSRTKPTQPKAKTHRVEVFDQFHTAQPLKLDVRKPDRLLVPTTKCLDQPGIPCPTPLPPPGVGSYVDHFKCYNVKLSQKKTKFLPITGVAVEDQFLNAPKLFTLKKPTRLCNPVDKRGEGILNPDKHLMCYQVIRANKQQPRHRSVKGVHLSNQFGQGKIDTLKEEELCLPAQKTDLGVVRNTIEEE